MEIKIKELLDENGKTAQDLAMFLNKDKAIIYGWIRGRNVPNGENLVLIADYFNCSIEYLIGRTEDNSQTKFKKSPPFDEQLKDIMQQKGVSQYKLVKEKIVNPSHFYKWFNKKAYPNVDTLIKLADYFKVTIDYLVGREL